MLCMPAMIVPPTLLDSTGGTRRTSSPLPSLAPLPLERHHTRLFFALRGPGCARSFLLWKPIPIWWETCCKSTPVCTSTLANSRPQQSTVRVVGGTQEDKPHANPSILTNGKDMMRLYEVHPPSSAYFDFVNMMEEA